MIWVLISACGLMVVGLIWVAILYGRNKAENDALEKQFAAKAREAKIASRPHSKPDAILDRMKNGDL